jgi:hypothetical protein
MFEQAPQMPVVGYLDVALRAHLVQDPLLP